MANNKGFGGMIEDAKEAVGMDDKDNSRQSDSKSRAQAGRKGGKASSRKETASEKNE